MMAVQAMLKGRKEMSEESTVADLSEDVEAFDERIEILRWR